MELDLVQKVELRLLLAKTDDKFGAAVNNFLTPLLQKLNSSNLDVVAKTVEILKFIKRRRNETDAFQLPLEKLTALLHSTVTDPKMIRQNRQALAFVALELSLSNTVLPIETFVHGLRLVNTSDQSLPSHCKSAVEEMVGELFSLFLLTLVKMAETAVSNSNNSSALNTNIECDVKQWDADDLAVVQEKLTEFMLLDLKHRKLNNQYGALKSPQVSFFVDHGHKNGILFPQKNDGPMNQCRRAVVQLAQSFPDIFANTLTAGMGDPILEVSRKCRLEVLKMKTVDFDFVSKLCITGNTLLRTNAMELLTRLRYYQSVNLNLVKSALAQEDLKLRQAALVLLKDAVLSSESNKTEHLKCDSHALIQNLRQYIFDDGWPRSQIHSAVQTQLRQICYELLGLLSSDFAIASFLLSSLDRDMPDMASSIQKALSHMMSRGNVNIDPKKLMEIMLYSNNYRTRYSAVLFANRLPKDVPMNCAILLLGTDKSKNSSDIIMEAQTSLLVSEPEELPAFQDMLDTLNEVIDWKGASKETIDICVMYLLTCLTRTPPASADWISETRASMETSPQMIYDKMIISGEGNVLMYIKFLTHLILNMPYTYCETLPIISSKVILYLNIDQRRALAQSMNLDAVKNTLQEGNSEYCSFLAEYLPILLPNVTFSIASQFTILYDAYRQALIGSQNNQVINLAESQYMADAIKVLTACNIIKDNKCKLNAGDNQLVQAYIGMNSGDMKHRRAILEELFMLTPKSFDDIVSNGEAISIVVSGWHSKCLKVRYPYLVEKYQAKEEAVPAPQLEELSLAKVVKGIRGSPESRRIASVRLLCLTQNSFYDGSKHAGFANGIQTCFMNLLSDSDDVTQESAGRGLSILFENGENDKSIQQHLLIALLSSFTDDVVAKKNTSGTLTAETQVFEPGALPSDPRGKESISTYKDIMDLANETGDSSLVYKFMSLSSNSQIWTGRKGIAFSLQQIIARSEVSQQILNGSEIGNKLIPKLFRYLYDPIEVTKEAMKHIWVTLVPGTQRSKVIQHYFPLILKELHNGVIDRQWRVRQASCSALSDMISNGSLEGTVDILKIAFRAIDDIKESVSSAGKELLTSLSNSLVRKCSKQGQHDSELNEIIPFLVNGINHEASARFSLDILLKLSETKMFQPYAVTVLTEIVLQLSSLEPQALNYFSQHMGQNTVDMMREAGMQSSPVIQAVESMVERGSPTNEEMWDVLPSLIKKSVGVPSKLAAARLLTLTCLRTYGSEKRGSRRLLKIVAQEVFGVSEVCSSSYASAMGYLCRHTPINVVADYIQELRDKYTHSEPDDDKTRVSMALALKKLSTIASDVFSSVSSIGLPLSFVGMATSDKEEANQTDKVIFKQIWDENTGGSASIKLYAPEILKFTTEIFQTTNSRSLKVSAALAVTAVMSVLIESPIGASTELRNQVDITAKTLKLNIGGRSWPKKEHLITAFDKAQTVLNENIGQ